MKNKFIMTAAIVTAMTMVTPSLASAAEIQPIASETEAPAEVETPTESETQAVVATETDSDEELAQATSDDGTTNVERTGWYGPEDGYPDYCYKLDDGNWAYSQFVSTETGTFYFDANGYMVRGWQKINSSWYYFDANGYMQKDWQEIGGKWYYFDQYSGYMYANCYYTVNNTKYVFAPSGQLIEGWTWDVYTDYDGDVKGDWFYANPNGTAYEDGWLAYNGDWYYISSYNGAIYSGATYHINDKYYKFKKDGKLIIGWYQTGIYLDDWYYANADGSAYSGWLPYNGSWYYFSDSEYMPGYMYSNGWVDNKYYMGRDGRMVSGWYDCSNKSANYSSTTWMYFNADGTKYVGWLPYNGNWYYINDNGQMLADTINACLSQDAFKDENGNNNWEEYYKACAASPSYVFDANGVMVTGWYHHIQTTGGQITYDEWYYSDSDGKGHDGWLLYNGAWYYFSKGEMLRNTYTPDGNWVGLDGVWA